MPPMAVVDMARALFDPLNKQAIAIEEAQSEIRIAVKEAFFNQRPRIWLDKAINEIISRALKKITLSSLRVAAQYSLREFYIKERRILERIPMVSLLIFLALTRLKTSKTPKGSPKPYGSNMTKKQALAVLEAHLPTAEFDGIRNLGNALNMYHEEYTRRYVIPTLDRMAKEEALDPEAADYATKRNTLRARAEREVRYQAHQDDIARLRADGVKLILVSAHADCSERCRPWQGRAYSLDHTSGKTSDGRDFIPLEIATDIPTPNGKWFNGLFGFGCRHFRVPYQHGLQFPTVSAKREREEYAITQRQRALERNVRRWRAHAEMYKGTDTEEYQRARRKAEEWNSKYIEYSRENSRPYYPSRTRLI